MGGFSSILAPVAGSLLGSGLQSAFGSSPKSQGPAIVGQSSRTDALKQSSNFTGGHTFSALERLRPVSEGVTEMFGRDVLGDLGGLRGETRGGHLDLEKARGELTREARGRALRTASDSLSRRRVLGASFATDVLADIERQFGREEAAQVAQGRLESLQAEVGLIQFEGQLLAEQAQREFAEIGINVQSNQAFGSMIGASNELAAMRAEREGAAQGQFFGSLGSQLGTSLFGTPSDIPGSSGLLGKLSGLRGASSIGGTFSDFDALA